MSIESINEPGESRLVSHTPPSINEPPELPDLPAPVVTVLTPDSCAIGDPDFDLVVSGENFYAGSVIFFAGHDEPTTFNEADRTVSTIVKPSLWQSPVVVQCQVHNGEVMSNAVDFTFTAPAGEGAAEDDIKPGQREGAPVHRGRPTRTLPHKRKS